MDHKLEERVERRAGKPVEGTDCARELWHLQVVEANVPTSNSYSVIKRQKDGLATTGL